MHEAALARGVKVVGATVHFVDEGTDTGPIILQKPVMVEPGDTPEVFTQFGPTPVSIHNDGHMLGYAVHVQLFLVCLHSISFLIVLI